MLPMANPGALTIIRACRVCKDEDENGQISIAEFKEAWANSEELQQHLQIMGIREQDMEELLRIMDITKSGHSNRHEFVEQFTQLRTGADFHFRNGTIG